MYLLRVCLDEDSTLASATAEGAISRPCTEAAWDATARAKKPAPQKRSITTSTRPCRSPVTPNGLHDSEHIHTCKATLRGQWSTCPCRSPVALIHDMHGSENHTVQKNTMTMSHASQAHNNTCPCPIAPSPDTHDSGAHTMQINTMNVLQV